MKLGQNAKTTATTATGTFVPIPSSYTVKMGTRVAEWTSTASRIRACAGLFCCEFDVSAQLTKKLADSTAVGKLDGNHDASRLISSLEPHRSKLICYCTWWERAPLGDPVMTTSMMMMMMRPDITAVTLVRMRKRTPVTANHTTSKNTGCSSTYMGSSGRSSTGWLGYWQKQKFISAWECFLLSCRPSPSFPRNIKDTTRLIPCTNLFDKSRIIKMHVLEVYIYTCSVSAKS